MAITLEFYKLDGTKSIYVSYNGKRYKIEDFFCLPEAGKIVTAMYDEIAESHPYEIKEDEIQTVGNFIHNHFLKLDKIFDVVILGEDSHKMSVRFNLEDPNPYRY